MIIFEHAGLIPEQYHWLVDFVLASVVVSSILYSILPPFEKFNEYPRFQSGYKFFLIFLQAIAINGRGSLMKYYSSYKNGGQSGQADAQKTTPPTSGS